MARSGHYNHQRHAQQQAQFFARVEAERRMMRTVGSFDNMEFDRNMPLTFTTVPATDESDDAQPEADEAADYSWTHDRS